MSGQRICPIGKCKLVARQSSTIHDNLPTRSFVTTRSFSHFAISHEVGFSSSKDTPEVWRARLQRGGPQGVERSATVRARHQ